MAEASQSTARRPRPLADLAWAVVGLTLLGAILLKAPGSPAPGRPLPWIEAVFTSAAAVCGTGLSLRDPATRWSPLGQLMLGLLIQAGAIVYALAGARVVGRWLDLLAGERGDGPSRLEPPVRVRGGTIILGLLALELLGAAAMLPAWPGEGGWPERVGQSLFQAVSAAGNSGLSIAPDGLASARRSYIPLAVIAPLVVLGGLGLPVLQASAGAFGARVRAGARKLLTVWAAAYLLGVGAILLAQLAPRAYHALALGNEPNQPVYEPLTARSFGGLLADASFLSATSHAGGFSALAPDDLRPAAQWALVPLMMLGGAPGGAAGGLGLAALALLLCTRRNVHDSRREGMTRAAGQALLAMLACWVAGVFLLCVSEPFPPFKLMFEAASALGDSGLSQGVTGDVTTMGRLTLIALMFAGRVLPLGLLARATASADD